MLVDILNLFQLFQPDHSSQDFKPAVRERINRNGSSNMQTSVAQEHEAMDEVPAGPTSISQLEVGGGSSLSF